MKRIKRFYDTVSVNKLTNGRFSLLLDGKSVKTPLGEPLTFPSEAVASAVATEWELQSAFVIPNTMPINTIMMTYIDVDSRMSRNEKLEQINRYIQTDTVRFPDTDPESELAALQTAKWGKVHSFLEKNGVSMNRSLNGIGIPASSTNEIEQINTGIMAKYNPLTLTMLETASKYLKSGTIGISLLEGIVSPREAFEAAYVDELWQRTNWGLVEGDHDISDAETMLWLNGISILASLVDKS